jgi:hypothetical protein
MQLMSRTMCIPVVICRSSATPSTMLETCNVVQTARRPDGDADLLEEACPAVLAIELLARHLSGCRTDGWTLTREMSWSMTARCVLQARHAKTRVLVAR